MPEPTGLRALPRVDAVLAHADAAALCDEHGRGRLTDTVRAVLDAHRRRLRDAAEEDPQVPVGIEEVLAQAAAQLAGRAAGRLRQVINATGVVVHTNLGRAPLSAAAREAVAASAGYTNLEYDLDTGRRGSRTAAVGSLAAELCTTPAATVVNNGAAALLLALTALAAGREVVVSRGELIEIGGSFRLPEVMAVSGARMVEVGTTNRTRIADYRAAIGPDTAVLLKAHRSNFRVTGFTAEASPAELAALAREHDLAFVHDLGSGLITRPDPTLDPAGVLGDEPVVHEVVDAGADLVLFSGDKLLGGPQAGILAGTHACVESCARHPLARALRIDKLQRAALEATLLAHLRGRAQREVPVPAMLAAPLPALRERAAGLLGVLVAQTDAQAGAQAGTQPGAQVAEHSDGEPRGSSDGGAVPLYGWDVEVAELEAVVGGGAAPEQPLASAGIRCTGGDAAGLAAALRHGQPSVVARVAEDRVLLDLRTVAPDEDAVLAAALSAALRAVPSGKGQRG